MLTILVTGAAGLVGGELCARLVARGHRVLALVHRNPAIVANDGRHIAVDAVLTGDIAEPLLGLSDDALATALAADLIIHCAATVRFDLEEADYARTNIGGTRHVVALAQAAGAALLHVSTAYVCGKRGGAIAEAPVPAGTRFANGYEASKAVAEAIVAASGLIHAIARPSIIVGDSQTGAIRQFDTIYAAFKVIAEGRVRSLPSNGKASLDFVPIDHVANGLVAIAERIEDASGGIFHLVSGGAMPLARFAAIIGSYPQFVPPAFVPPEAFDPAQLLPLERRIYGRIAALYATYFQRDPAFSDAALRRLAGLSGPPCDVAFGERMIAHCIAVGFLPGAASAVA